MLAWLTVRSETQIVCIWSSWCHCHPIISCFIKIQIGLTLGCPGKDAIKRVPVCLNEWVIIESEHPLLTVFTCRSSRTCGPDDNTVSTQAGSLNVTNPKPLDFPVAGFFMTTQSMTSPYRLKYLSIEPAKNVGCWYSLSKLLHVSYLLMTIIKGEMAGYVLTTSNSSESL